MKAPVILLASVLLVSPTTGAAAADLEAVRACVQANAPRLSAVQRLAVAVQERDGSVSQTRAKITWRSYTDEPARFVVRMEAPEDLEGAALLAISNPGGLPTAFVYLPALDDTRKVSSAEQARSIFPDELPLEEMRQMLTFWDQGTLALMGSESLEGRDVWRLEARPGGEGGSAYERIVAWIDQEYCIPTHVDFFEKGDRLRRQLRVPAGRIERFASSWFPEELRLEDLIDGTRSTVTFSDIEIDVGIAPALMTPKALSLPGR